jgi:hypothetical protein
MLGPDPSSVESFAKFQFDWFFTAASNEIINHFFCYVAMDDDEFLSDGESTNGESEDDLPNDSEEETSDPFNDGEVLSSF